MVICSPKFSSSSEVALRSDRRRHRGRRRGEEAAERQIAKGRERAAAGSRREGERVGEGE